MNKIQRYYVIGIISAVVMLSDAIFTEIIVLVHCNTTRLYIRPILSSPMTYLNGNSK
jgi:hypothetical protein